ncbi:MAG: glucosaminidase domain-containing protein [Bacteroidota bacterium]
MIPLCLLLLLTITGFSDGNEGVKDNSSRKTEDILRRADLIIRNAEAISRKNGVKVINTDSKRTFPSVMIMGWGRMAPGNLIRFMLERNSDLDSNYVKRLIYAYISESRREGVNHDVAVCQMCLETGFLRFSGSVSRYQNNFCGLGAVNAWTGGDWFKSLEEGVRAHVQHLKAYASFEPVNSPLVDKRFDNVQRGIVVTIHDLTGKWATDPNYGIKIDYLLKTLYAK